MESTRVIVEVWAGVIPGTPEPEHTRRWTISSERWHELATEPGKQSQILAELNGAASGYAGLLMLQPDRFNWVRTEWLWL